MPRRCSAGQAIRFCSNADGHRDEFHQCGTLRFGHDSARSVLDPYCRAHDLDNLYVVDASFFPSSAAVNPALTIAAQALRVGDHLRQRLGAVASEERGKGEAAA